MPTRSRIAAEIAMVFVVCVMMTGEAWERFEWSVRWTWDSRLTTYLIWMPIVCLLRAARGMKKNEKDLALLGEEMERRRVAGKH